ncbi:MAG: OmpA family protein, partial [Chitinophagaceae bacterium]
KWLRGYQNNRILSGNTKAFGENYTIEFDLLFSFNSPVGYYVYPDLEFGLLSSGDRSTTDNSLLANLHQNASYIRIHPKETSIAWMESYADGRLHFKSDDVKLEEFMGRFNSVQHYSIQVQKTRLRCWVNERKLFDMPRAVNSSLKMNQLFFSLGGSSYGEDQVGYFLSNIKVATGVPDSRHKLVEEGKFSTTGILFAVNSAVIKPASYAVVKEIATVLKENAGLKINITGHTSSDGNAKANLELSRQRAASVKAMLVKEFGIPAENLSTDGKGDAQPAADNKTQEGRIQNRRVEFIKL